MKKLITLCLFTIFLSCDSKKAKTETVTINNKYSVELPDFLSKGTELHEEASLQYQNLFKEFYVIILDEPKEEIIDAAPILDIEPTLEGYYSYLKSSMEETIEEVKFMDVKNTKINGLNAKTFSVTGKVDGIDAFYKIAYIEGKDTYYQVLIWSLLKKQEKYTPEMEKIIASFKEIGSSKSADRSKK